mmetsp:Transcript_20288/g.58660  ORF Transcript_20288/g.58660 Transcript_20288/m.58660 type:complete len:252 (+) Transcript_20288:984-1739(+)
MSPLSSSSRCFLREASSLTSFEARAAALKSRCFAADFFCSSNAGRVAPIFSISSVRLLMAAFAAIRTWLDSSTAASYFTTSVCRSFNSSSFNESPVARLFPPLLSTLPSLSPLPSMTTSLIIIPSSLYAVTISSCMHCIISSCATSASEWASIANSCDSLRFSKYDFSASHSRRLSASASSFFARRVVCLWNFVRTFSIVDSWESRSDLISAASFSFAARRARRSVISSVIMSNLRLGKRHIKRPTAYVRR